MFEAGLEGGITPGPALVVASDEMTVRSGLSGQSSARTEGCDDGVGMGVGVRGGGGGSKRGTYRHTWMGSATNLHDRIGGRRASSSCHMMP